MVKRQMKKPKRNDQLLTNNKYIYKIHSVIIRYATIKKATVYKSLNIEAFYSNRFVL